MPNEIRDINYITLKVEDYVFALPVRNVEDVIVTPQITPIPLSDKLIVGLLNLRGRIVTAIDMGVKLSLNPEGDKSQTMSVVVDIEGELYGMMVDEVGEITNFNNPDLLDTNPNAVDPRWRQFTLGVYQEDENLIVILDDNLIFNDI